MHAATRILVVDDEPDLASLFRQKFRQDIRAGNLAFFFAEDGVAALETLMQDPEIDILFTDLQMPRLDGMSLLGRLPTLGRPVKAVVVTAYGDLRNVRAAMNQGAFDFLVKPIDLDDLEITLYNVITAAEQQKREILLRETFGRYLSADVGTLLLSDPDSVKLGGERRKVTLLMSDLRGFTNIAEQLSPEQVVETLNIYLGRMADVITDHRGTIDEFIGDAILVIFGAPFQSQNDSKRAVACAIEMQLAMSSVNARLLRQELPALEMGIAINTGEVVVGNVGSVKRMKYGVVGSAVNQTARIESYSVGGQILLGERTKHEIGQHLRIGRRLNISAKGFADPITAYEVIGLGPPYDLEVPTTEKEWITLSSPFPVECTMLDGKYLSGEPFEAEMLKLAANEAVLRADGVEGPFTKLKITVSAATTGAPATEALYANVVKTDADRQLLTVRFTRLPTELEAAVQAHGVSER